ncbi:M15 family metallopeptidase [Chitinimonas sp. BJB300]|uniref:M15 family metallopeptidase n=1 Tax=Chitinimonas sp. BJB300 TaxID=1559339 RepID=UPI000C0F47A6|nr:M15 family metallopeptidase [Chitinimonas sp. BJB300]PHV13369.1 hypothetical protein CSQ89_01010 [Chitinimonas sp. BJB300]TSJ85286.1 M15 family metallopeptidase [Chitinimonas sp. BJB300]
MYENYLVIFAASVLLALVLLAGLLLLSAGLRARFARVFSDVRLKLQQRRAASMTSLGDLQSTVGEGGRSWIQKQFDALARNKWLLLATLCVLATPLILVAILSNQISTEGYEDIPAEENAVIAQLLRGEQLVPPPPLPPEAFLTQEVEMVRPMLVSASRDWMLLDGEFRQRLLVAFRVMEEKHGYKMALLEGYRSPSRQNTLAALGPQVSNARAFQSYHQFGLAADCAFLRNGKLVISERDPWAMRGYELYGEVAESLGLVWGGRWKMMDFGHIELRRKGALGKPPATADGAEPAK